MSGETTEQRVLRVIAKTKKIPVEQISAATTFEELSADSFDALNIIFALEEEFEISIPNEAAVKMKSVGQAIAGVEELRAAQSASTDAP